MSCEIVIRRARAADEPVRARLVRLGYTGHQYDAFLLFFFQELTLQLLVLGGAVLFIFCGASVRACLALLPAAAAALAGAVYLAHLAAADKQVQNMRKEEVGFVAEYRGPVVVDPATLRPSVVTETEAEKGKPNNPIYTEVVGTASVSDYWGPRSSGWLHALAVHPSWRRRGAGRALAGAARAHAAGAGLRSLECVLSELQPHARALLHAAGWEVRGWYHRRVCGAALTLLLAQLGLELPHA